MIPQTDAKAGQPYTLRMVFDGDADYSIAEYGSNGAGGWKKKKDVQVDGDSTDAQHDAYDMSPVAVGQSALIKISANIASATGDAAVSMAATLTQGGATLSGPPAATGQDTGGVVALLIVFTVKGV